MEKQQIKCPKCNKESIKKDGKRKTENRGLIQRYRCKECSHRFVLDDGFYRMRNSPQKITCAMDLFYRGVSTRKIQEHFSAFYPHNSSHKSIYKWIIKYAKAISNFTDGLKIKVGREIQMDEMEYRRRKQRDRKGVDKNWFIDVIDCQSRFMIASDYTKSRGQKELKQVIKNVKEKTGEQIKVITTDGLQGYYEVIKRVFGYTNIKDGYVKHNKVNASKGEGFNIMIERLHNSLRARTKTFRGFHGSIESANAIMKGLAIYYNFITRHQAINCCPYELAMPELKLNSNNKWLELIQKSKGINNLISM